MCNTVNHLSRPRGSEVSDEADRCEGACLDVVSESSVVSMLAKPYVIHEEEVELLEVEVRSRPHACLKLKLT